MVAHARHGRLEPVGGDPRRAAPQARHDADQSHRPPAAVLHGAAGVRRRAAGAGMADLDRGRRTGDRQVTRSAVRMIALAERFRLHPQLPADHVGSARPPGRRAGGQGGVRRRGVVVRRPGAGRAAGRRAGGAAAPLARRVAVEQSPGPEVAEPARCRCTRRAWRRRWCRSRVPISRPRRVSMNGVNGWYSAKTAQPGRHRLGRDEPAAQERQQEQRHGRVAGGLDGPGRHAQRDRQPGQRERDDREHARPARATPPGWRTAGSRSASATPRTKPMAIAVWIRRRRHGRSAPRPARWPWCGSGR